MPIVVYYYSLASHVSYLGWQNISHGCVHEFVGLHVAALIRDKYLGTY